MAPALSQTLVKENNRWSNLVEVSTNTFTFHFQKISGDTLINGKIFKKLLGASSPEAAGWKYEAALSETVPGKVTIIHAGSADERLLYDFTLTVNDNFTGYYKNCEYTMKLNAVEDIWLMNGEKRKQFQFSGNGASGFFTENWIAEIGSDNGLTSAGIYSCTAVTDTAPTLNCFTEDNIVKVYNNADYPCVETVGISEKKTKNGSALISPNPVHESACFEVNGTYNKDLELLVFDTRGKKVSRIHSDTNILVFNRKELKPGLYYYAINSETKLVASGKFIIE
jgi:hypothetical protein